MSPTTPTRCQSPIPASFPDLFAEGQGVITQGKLGADGIFIAEEVLAKHDETYMPPEVADALEKGHEEGVANMQKESNQ